jgi:hypothetical protein
VGARPPPPTEIESAALISTPADLPQPPTSTAKPLALGLSAGSLAVIAAAMLVYVSGSFVLAEALGIKRTLQGVLAVPTVVVASYYLAVRPQRMLNPLIGFIVLKTVAELAFRGSELDLFDDVASLFALIVISGAPRHVIMQGARTIMVLAGAFALMALGQWIALFLQPDLRDELLSIDDDGQVVGTVHHVVALLGLATGEQYTLLGHPVSRLQSWAREPSLNVVYFLLPAVIAFLRGGKSGKFWGTVMVGFCVLSLSGSVLLSLAFSAGAWLALRFLSVKMVLAWGTLGILGVYLAALHGGNLGSVVNFISFLSDYGDFLSKEKSFTYRAGGAANSLASAIAAPLGGTKLAELPGPWMINGAIAAGWLGAFMLLLFVFRLASQLQILNFNHGRQLNVRLGTLILIGAMTTVIVFNDYQMCNYPGLILVGIVCRMIEAQNEADRELRGAFATSRPPPGSREIGSTAEHAAQPP